MMRQPAAAASITGGKITMSANKFEINFAELPFSSEVTESNATNFVLRTKFECAADVDKWLRAFESSTATQWNVACQALVVAASVVLAVVLLPLILLDARPSVHATLTITCY